MVDPQDYDLSTVLVDPVQDPVGAAPGRPDPIKVFAERLADSMRVVQQCRRDEVDDGGRDASGSSSAIARRAGGARTIS